MVKGQSALLALEEKLRNNEISSLHKQLFEHQAKSDDKATIGTVTKATTHLVVMLLICLLTGKLHRQLTALQASEMIALQQLEQANAKVCS